MRRLRGITRQHVGVALAASALVLFLAALVAANDNSDEKVAVQQTTQENVGKQLEALQTQLTNSEATRRQLTADRERWQAQITTSIEQLRAAGETPIIVAPDAVMTSTPITSTTTTTSPPVSDPPTSEPTPTTETPSTTPPSTEPPTTAPPSTTPPSTEPPTTEPPTTEPPTEETTTTTEEP